MTTKRFRNIFYLIVGICISIMIFSFYKFDFVEVDNPIHWTITYFAIPILLISGLFSFFVYNQFLEKFEKYNYTSIFLKKLRTFSRILFLTLGLAIIFVGTTISTILITNAYSGKSQEVYIESKVVDYYIGRSNRGAIKHYIKIQDDKLDRIIELRVKQPYSIGQTFKKSMFIGRWGLLYSEK